METYEPVAFVALETGDDLIVSFFVPSADDPSDGRSITLLLSESSAEPSSRRRARGRMKINFTKMEAQRWWLGGFGAAWAASGSTRSVDEVSIRQPERGG
jgi:hypothetical protein